MNACLNIHESRFRAFCILSRTASVSRAVPLRCPPQGDVGMVRRSGSLTEAPERGETKCLTKLDQSESDQMVGICLSRLGEVWARKRGVDGCPHSCCFKAEGSLAQMSPFEGFVGFSAGSANVLTANGGKSATAQISSFPEASLMG